MLKNIVVVKLKPGYDKKRVEALWADLNNEINPSTYPGMVHWTPAWDLGMNPSFNWTYGITSEFETKEALQAYADSPVHVRVGKELGPMIEGAGLVTINEYAAPRVDWQLRAKAGKSA